MRTSPTFALPLRSLALMMVAAAATACSDSDPAGPVDEPFHSLTVDASAGWRFVALGEDAVEVQVTDPRGSDSWDIGFFATGVMLNGGAAGPGQVEGYCLCGNESATDEQIVAMNPESERPAFELVTAADIPTDADAWETDALAPAMQGWWSYDMATHAVSPVPEKTWIVRSAEGTAFAKLRVVGIDDPTQQHAGTVTLEFAVQPSAAEPYGETRTLTVDLSAGAVHVDLVEGAVSDASDWDIQLEGYTIRTNGGVSGSGEAAAAVAETDFGNAPGADELDERAFATDAFGGVFEAHPWYRYNLQGNHQIWPNYNVYLIRAGEEVYKIQLTGYYNPTDGESRFITFRYAPLVD